MKGPCWQKLNINTNKAVVLQLLERKKEVSYRSSVVVSKEGAVDET